MGNYEELCIMAYHFAQFYEYDYVICDGVFKFYNSPIAMSFGFDVDPLTFDETPQEYILEQFELGGGI